MMAPEQNSFSFSLMNWMVIGLIGTLMLYHGAILFIPLSYGLFIAIVLYPVCRWLEQHHVPRSLAIAMGLLIVFLLAGILVWLFIYQLNILRQDIPILKAKLIPTIEAFRQWATDNWDISAEQQDGWLESIKKQVPGQAGNLIAGTISKTSTGLFMLVVIPVFVALFLYDRRIFVLFLEKLAGRHYYNRLHRLLHDTITTYFHFIKGMVLVYLMVGALNSLGLWLLGVPHAFLFGFLTAIMTIIPYIGISVSALLPMTVAWITTDNIWYPIGVVAIFSFVQYLEANVIFPKVVGREINVSTWATLVALIAGGLLWGVNGMILFIPFLAILKMVSDEVPEWEALNLLLRRN